MAERDALQKRYAYQEMSNKVEQADRSQLVPRSTEQDGARSLRGRTDVGRMGDRVPAPDDEAAATRRRRAAEEEAAARASKRRRARGGGVLEETGGRSVLDLGRLTGYRPTHAGSREAYEGLLTTLGGKELLGSQPPSVVRDAAEEILGVLKDDGLRDPERRSRVSESLLGKADALDVPTFSRLVALGKRVDDFRRDDGTNDGNDDDGPEDADRPDEEMGVAVVFDDDDDERDRADDDDDDDGAAEIAASSSSEEEDVEDVLAEDDDLEDDDDGDVRRRRDDAVPASASVAVVPAREIDAHWLQRELAKRADEEDAPSDPAAVARAADEALSILEDGGDDRECENRLLVSLGFDRFPLIRTLLRNRVRVWACVRLRRADADERRRLERVLKDEPTGEGRAVWDELFVEGRAEDWTRDRMDDARKRSEREKARLGGDAVVAETREEDEPAAAAAALTELDLDALAFGDRPPTTGSRTCELPEKSWRATHKGYEEVHVPATKTTAPPDEKLVPISDLPEWTRPAFKGMNYLNRIQSKMCDVALKTSENLLLCAPTGAGKTNVAMLTMLNVLGQYRREDKDDDDDDPFDASAFKIVYVAPMKALVQEVVKNFSKRLAPFGVVVRELSGDASLTSREIADTQLIVTTPEKWDVVTRQGEGRAHTRAVRLVILDEIHLLADERGAVLEAVIARTLRRAEETREPTRLVGLSATLPNYRDVAAALRAKPDVGVFFFDASHRPVPLHMRYVGLTERHALRRARTMNEICYERVRAQRRRATPDQVLVFVHGRAECGRAARALRDMSVERNETDLFARDGGASKEILRDEVAEASDADLREVLADGLGVHHAGMNRTDRELVEDLFADGHVAVLCCTATLAWGVNLPAHAVVVRGTQIYDPRKGRWAELSPLDVLQMLGRAGRPPYDTEGEGIILTNHSELQYYLSLTNLQLPIESRLIPKLPDHLNAEVVLGNVRTVQEAADWITYTFLYVRMLRNPTLYGVADAEETLRSDPTLRRRRLDLAHTAARVLERHRLLRYDRRSGELRPSPLGRVASRYYVHHASVAAYDRRLRGDASDVELLRTLSGGGEFAVATVREDERSELRRLAARVPIPVKEPPTEPAAKVNVLLQAHVSRLRLDGLALASDAAFVRQSAARLTRALFEIALRRRRGALARSALDLANAVARRVWRCQSPLRQFPNVPEIVCRRLERKTDVGWSRYADLTAGDLGELVGAPRMGKTLRKLVRRFPRLELAAHAQPVSRTTLRVELTLTPDFEYDVDVHGPSQLFHVFVEDADGERLLHHETFVLRSGRAEEEHATLFTAPLLDPLPPAYFVRVLSDRWLGSEAVLPISLGRLILPARFPPPTELLDLRPLPLSAVGEPALVDALYSSVEGFDELNAVQTQTHSELARSDRNVLVCAPEGSGKTACAEFAILRDLGVHPDGACVYVTPKEEVAASRHRDWKERFGRVLGPDRVVRLGGDDDDDAAADLRALAAARVVVCTAERWDAVGRRWRQRRAVQNVTLLVVDDLHMLGGGEGPTLEIVVSRARYVDARLRRRDPPRRLRLVGLAAPIADARDVADWMGVPSRSLFAFGPAVRPVPLELSFRGFDQDDAARRLAAMGRPVYDAVAEHVRRRPDDAVPPTAVVFVPGRRQASLTAVDLVAYQESADRGDLVGRPSKDLDHIAAALDDPVLRRTVAAGVGVLHRGLSGSDRATVTRLYVDGVVAVLVCPADACWDLVDLPSARLVVIAGAERYDGRERRHVDYPVADVLRMIAMAGRPKHDVEGKCVVLCRASKKDHLRRLLQDPLPVESHLDHYLHDHFNSEIVTKTITSMQDAVDYITWTFLYRRLTKNPNYYNLQGTSNVHLSEHMSEMAETVLGDLEESRCCKISDDGDVVSPLNLGMIAAYYYVRHTTVELIASSVTAKTKTKGILEILAAASEFDDLDVRPGEERALRTAAAADGPPPPDARFHDPNTKALVLLRCHLRRRSGSLSTELRADQRTVARRGVALLRTVVDVVSSRGWLRPALAAMELSQMIVQAAPSADRVLSQIPHFNDDVVDRCVARDEPIESVFDVLALDDDVRNDLLRLPDDKMSDVAAFCNGYPNVEVSFRIVDADDVAAGDPVRVVVDLEREVDDDDDDDDERLGVVSAPRFPGAKREGWWIVVGDPRSNKLLSLKRVSLRRTQRTTLEFVAPDEPGDHDLALFCMSDSYLGCDQEMELSLSVAAAVDDDDDDESEDDQD